jgi:hypothetical protein
MYLREPVQGLNLNRRSFTRLETEMPVTIPKATKYEARICNMIFIAFTLQQWLHESASLLRYTYIGLSCYSVSKAMFAKFVIYGSVLVLKEPARRLSEGQ